MSESEIEEHNAALALKQASDIYDMVSKKLIIDDLIIDSEADISQE